MLLVQEYLKTKTFGQLALEHGAYASFAKSGHKWSMNYDQIEARESDPLAQECRGLVLATTAGTDLSPQARLVNGRLNYDDVCPGETVVLAFPLKRFFNFGQGAAAKIEWSDPNVQVMEKLDGCFNYDTPITCWDGSSLRIGEIVKNKLTPTLIGIDDCGNFVPCTITNWFNNGIKNNWLEIETDRIFHSKNRKFKITSNHSVLINDNFIPIINAKIGDKLSSYENVICDWTIHLIRSSLLGDATISKNGNNFKFEEGHKEDHQELTLQMEKWLGDNFSHKRKCISGFGSKMIRVSSIPNVLISNLRKEWYENRNGKNIKILPENLDWINDFTIAKWYMDDGSLAHNDSQSDRACFATNNFSEKEVIRLDQKLTEMYGVDCTVYYSKGWCLRVNSGKNKEIDNLWQRISPYIVPCMRYKLPLIYRSLPFTYGDKVGKLNKVKKEVKILSIKDIGIENLKNKKELFPHGRRGYDIETTSHNYMANKVIVHNSLTIVYFDKFKKDWCVATRSVSEADLPLDGAKFTFRTLFEKALFDTKESLLSSHSEAFSNFTGKLDKSITYCFELCTPYNRVVVNYKDCRVTLLAARNITSMLEIDLHQLNFPNYSDSTKRSNDLFGVPLVKTFNFSDIHSVIDWVSTQNPLEYEGVVVRDPNFNRIKVKNAAYVAFSKARDVLGTSDRNCLELILAEKEDDVIPALPQEIVNNLLKIKEGYRIWMDIQQKLYNQIKLESDAILPGDKKTFALQLQKHKVSYPGAFFTIFDGKVQDMKEYVKFNRKGGSWPDSFLDKILHSI